MHNEGNNLRPDEIDFGASSSGEEEESSLI